MVIPITPSSVNRKSECLCGYETNTGERWDRGSALDIVMDGHVDESWPNPHFRRQASSSGLSKWIPVMKSTEVGVVISSD